ncbi:MAG: hypothetical protein QM538_03310 [Methylacidiphilales bacterium]|nr:hypothetical protein [Candidatus Methylacidiphilales bacterium]
MKDEFDMYLLNNAIDVFGIEYQKVTNTFHPTKHTNAKGEVVNEINTYNVGILYSDEAVATNYLFDNIFLRQRIREKQY